MSATQEDVWTKFKDFMGGTVFKTISEIHLLMPDSILFGSILMYFLTQNVAFGVFSIFLLETVLSHKLISWVSAQSVGESRSIDIKCRAGYKIPQFNVARIFSHDSYPSYSIYSLTSIAVYLKLAMNDFKGTLTAMGPEWESRATVASTFIGLLLATFIGFRYWSCDGFTEILIAITFAIVASVIFYYVNKSVFGEESMNFLGLPYMVSKESQASPIYVCAAEKDDPTSA